ncbi:hypothetical protein QF031_001815 [Pseudarthrobacter defluvii]|uniref:hypothetical protein n=1 Tax=Pseudarthrobacter defluvii TaxID=410837 RepID=UPI00278AE1B1|nr:hypothetical protein [Pseudarthrobacter defluvii]MDQ0769066.1 hypothetical protein [Pseudarthrobacter defluvii]
MNNSAATVSGANGKRRPGRHALAAAISCCVALAANACTGTPSHDDGESTRTDVFVTAYTWFDNTPPGSAVISHPVVHKSAGGTGTYADPVTIAVGHSRKTGQDVLDIPAGTRIYLPDVRRYFIVEDTCGDGPKPEDGPCHTGAEKYGDATLWIDMWIGGKGESQSFVRNCARKATGVTTAIFNPKDHYKVASGHGVIHDGTCDTGYGKKAAAK